MSSTQLQDTADKLAVVETLYRFAAGIDLRDEVLLASAFTEDAISDFRFPTSGLPLQRPGSNTLFCTGARPSWRRFQVH